MMLFLISVKIEKGKIEELPSADGWRRLIIVPAFAGMTILLIIDYFVRALAVCTQFAHLFLVVGIHILPIIISWAPAISNSSAQHKKASFLTASKAATILLWCKSYRIGTGACRAGLGCNGEVVVRSGFKEILTNSVPQASV